MAKNISLKQTATGWKFPSEATLEKFIWEYLSELFDLEKLALQYTCNGERCDILAIKKNGQLVVLELKNKEDRYIIQQLTRYHANLLEEKPFANKIDYSFPIELIAIAPTYHRHNFIDQEHSRLSFQLLDFFLVVKEKAIYFVLQDQQRKVLAEKSVLYAPVVVESVEGIPDPPEKLLTWLGHCIPEEQQGFLKVRNKILGCNPKMKEIVERNYILYQTTENKICSEIRFHQKSQKPVLFFWIKTHEITRYGQISKKKPRYLKWRMYTDGCNIVAKALVEKGFDPKPLPKSFAIPIDHTEVGCSIHKIIIAQESINEGLDSWDVMTRIAINRFEILEFQNQANNLGF